MTADLQPDSADVSWPTSGARGSSRGAHGRRAGDRRHRTVGSGGDGRVADALDTGTHLLVQAGTGTGKSLGYLVPALTWLTQHPGERIVVATATLALQSQLADKDILGALDAVEQVTGHRPVHAILKGRTNYACLLAGARRDFCSSGHLAVRRRAGRDNAIVDTRRTRIRAWRRGRRAAEWAEEQATADGLRIAIRHRRIPNEAGSRFPSLFGSVLGPSAARTGTHASSRNRGMPRARRT